MSFSLNNRSNTTNIVSASNHRDTSGFEFVVIQYFSALDIKLDCIVLLNIGVRIANRSRVCCVSVRNATVAESCRANFAQFEVGLSVGNLVSNESSLGIIQKTVVLSDSVDGNNIHETSWESQVCSDSMIYFHNSLFQDIMYFLSSECILQAISDENEERYTFPQFVWALTWTRSKNAAKFIQHPVLGRCQPL